MSSEREHMREIFDRVRRLPKPDRAAYLDGLDTVDGSMRAQIEDMLAALDEAGPFLSEPTQGHYHAQPTVDLASADTMAPPLREGSGTRIGQYKLLQLIGEGGFGSVFMAEQEKPVTRKVALKIIKLGMDTRQVVARFEQERQALAMMDHPNIARVLDAGATESGRPFFAMELVKGDPIVEYCDKNNLSIHDRLELFAQVCNAVQHAHTKGIIHRDIKPSNILVSTQDGRPHTKVIDFGIAKATQSKLTEKTLFTEHKALIGTPEYMSPEQAEGSLDIDTRTDVYSLGVLLYELLTGTTPFSSKELRSAAYAEIQRIIREVEPPKPSTRLSNNTETIASIAAQRRIEPRKLGTTVRGELDWIVMKALEKDRQRRYETASGLATDIQRYLSGEAVVAAPPSRTYRFKKFIRRNRVMVTAVGAVALALVAGFGTALWQAREASLQRDAAVLAGQKEAQQRVAAEQQRTRADERAIAAETAERAAQAARDAEKQRADQLKKVSDFQARMLGQVDTTKAGVELMADVRERFTAALQKTGVPDTERSARADTLRRELVLVNATDAAAAMIDRTILRPANKTIDEQFKDDPTTDASLRQALADLYRTIGLYDAAMPLQDSALATRRRVLGEEHPDTLNSISSMGVLLQDQGKFDQAERYLREALEKFRRVLGEEHPDTLISINNMGALLWDQGKVAATEPYYREALEKRRRVLGEEHPDTLISINSMGVLLQAQGKLDQAEPYFREALKKRRRVLGEEHPQTLTSINNMGVLLQAEGKLGEAEPYYREALEKRRRVLGEEHPGTLNSINSMGFLLQAQGKLAEAEPYWREALEKSRRVLGEEHPSTLLYISNMGFLLNAQGKLDQAEPYNREALEKRRRVLGEEHPDTLLSINNMGSQLRAQGRLDQAEPYCREALEKSRRVLGEEHPSTLRSINNLGSQLQAQGKLDQAEPYYREALEKRRRVLGEEHPDTLVSINNIAGLLRDQGNLPQAEQYYREAVEKSVRVQGAEHSATLIFTVNFGRVLQPQGKNQEALDLLAPIEPAARRAFTGGNARRLADFLTALGRARVGVGYDADRFALAEANLLEAHPIYVATKDLGPTHKNTRECVTGLVDLYTAWDKAEPGKGYDAKAVEWKKRLSQAQEASNGTASTPATTPTK